MATLIKGDCLEVMKEIADGQIDMILCDLPYGRSQNRWDTVIPFDKLWEQYNRIIKDNGAICLFADGLFMADLMESNRKNWRYNLVWDKVLPVGFLNANRQPLRRHEEIVVFYKKQPTYNPQKVPGKKNHSVGKSEGKKKENNHNYNDCIHMDNADVLGDMKHPTSIITISKSHSSITVHPTEKPVELCEWLVKTYTNEGDLVLDNCMGAGSTGIACVNTGRRFIGIEIDTGYFNTAKERIENAESAI